MRSLSVFLLLAASIAAGPVRAQVDCDDLDGAYVHGQDPDRTYLGFFGSRFASDSIGNEFGDHGSRFRPDSVRNAFGTFGSQFSPFSATNPLTLTPPVIARDGQFLAFLTTNPIAPLGISLAAIDAECGTGFAAGSPAGTPLPPGVPPFTAGGGGDDGQLPVVDFGFSGLWWNPDRGGEGVNIDFGTLDGADFLLFAFYGYFNDRLPVYLVGGVEIRPGQTTFVFPVSFTLGAQFGTQFRSGDVATMPFGHVTLEFVSCTSIRMTFSPLIGSYSAETVALVRFADRQAGHACLE